jgi:uncharacterized membrane protein YeaQ/YmgE (transglycosylase-associated protein family)
MGAGGIAFLLISGFVMGVIAQMVGVAHRTWEWAVVGLVAVVGGYAASEWLGPLSTWGPEGNGMYLLPALIGVVVAGAVADLLIRRFARGVVPPT